MSTINKFKTIFFIIIGLCFLTMAYSSTSLDYIEVDIATDWTMNYFALPILITMIVSCTFIYLKFIRQFESKNYKSKLLTFGRTVLRILILTAGMTGLLIGTTHSVIILSNASGVNKPINLNAEIISYYWSTNSRGHVSQYIKIKDNQLDRIVELKVDKPYEIGQPFTKPMKIGKWGLLYSEH